MSLTVSSVIKKYGNKTVVDKLSFKIEKPGVFGLLGTNGAGKTTTIRMILGILEKNAGTISWNGRPVTRESVKFGYLPEERGLYPKAKIVDQLSYFAKLRGMDGKSVKKVINYWVDRLKVSEYLNSTAEQLSKGNQQKIQLITALIHDPELIVMDEPLSGLDPVNADLFKSVIYELIEKDKFIIMSSHHMQSIEDYCEDLVILKNGETVLNGNLKKIKASYGRTNLTISTQDDIDVLIKEHGIKLISKNATGYELKIKSDDDAYNLLQKIITSKIRLDKFEIREPSLHEIFIEKVGEQ
ncbi:ATP-binding cassette domain-containing protein [Clostridium estertheticum]|uniref:ABC transporter ATP-binding protein n=1 Tax=Clostridium estertheticum TaxID=238834 RepID=UPI001C7D4CBD|nr:ATP-binding cassette domain-containing protein [Clostridium estertheticum]MBX4261604.1 ATP-binding cassette domain-containing protein [Clostridium estertheticum]WLC70898.1 ATP-binding cassette domain-containing protein [Clostridium estertheticum]